MTIGRDNPPDLAPEHLGATTLEEPEDGFEVEDAELVGVDIAGVEARSGRIVHGDLHYQNVLAAPPGGDPARGEWLVIDPKPFVGDPAYDVTQHLLNCAVRVECDPRRTIGRLADLCGVDAERVGLWLFGRAACGSVAWKGLAHALAVSGLR